MLSLESSSTFQNNCGKGAKNDPKSKKRWGRGHHSVKNCVNILRNDSTLNYKAFRKLKESGKISVRQG